MCCCEVPQLWMTYLWIQGRVNKLRLTGQSNMSQTPSKQIERDHSCKLTDSFLPVHNNSVVHSVNMSSVSCINSMTSRVVQRTVGLCSDIIWCSSQHWRFLLLLLLLEMASDCHELFLRGETTSGVYTIQPMNAEPFEVFCEMKAGKWSKIPNSAPSVLYSAGWPAITD